MITLAGKLALVTGAGQGIGAALAEGLARAGAHVVATDVDAAAAEATAARIVTSGGQARGLTMDVTCADSCARAAGQAGQVSILVNNAGILWRGRLGDPGARAAWARTLDVNVTGMFNATTALLPALRATRGAIVNLASIQSFVAPPGSAAYSVSKGAVAQFTRALAAELAEDGIRVNAIAPGIVETRISAPTRADPVKLDRFLQHVPLRRTARPEELVGPAVFLASDAASYVTGAVLPVDGGYLAV